MVFSETYQKSVSGTRLCPSVCVFVRYKKTCLLHEDYSNFPSCSFGPFLDESTLIYWDSLNGKPSQNECWWIRMKHEFISLQYISRDSIYWHELDSMPVWVSKHMLGKMWDKIAYPCMFGHAWISLGMDKQFHRTLYCVFDYLSMLGLRLSHAIKGGSRLLKTGWIHICTKPSV